jgi:hypothetical protein
MSNESLLDQIHAWVGPAAHAPEALSSHAKAWLAELTLCGVGDPKGDLLQQAYPNLNRLREKKTAGAGWSVELGLMVKRFPNDFPLSRALWSNLNDRARQSPAVHLSSDQ